LRAYMLKDDPLRPPMNEVKGSFPSDALVGLYFRKLSDQTAECKGHLKMLLLQKKIQNDYGRHIPVFRYDANKGDLQKVESDSQARFNLYLNLKLSTRNSDGKVIANSVAQEIGDPKPF
jgi:hypothetical protein